MHSARVAPVLVLLLHLLLLAAAHQDLPDIKAHYPLESERPNSCQVAFRTEGHNTTVQKGKYIPFVGTSLVRDSQLLALRLLYSLDYPVKHFVLVAPRKVMEVGRVMKYEIRHFKEFGTNIILIACEEPPSVSEGWNAVFHALPEEPWGIYNARDTAWEPGSLAKAAAQFWPLVESKQADVGLVSYSNMDPWPAEMAKFNVFMLTRGLVNRFGYFDEAIYPAFCEDDDFVYRLKLLNPPAVITTLKDVFVVHGQRRTKQYVSGTTNEMEEGDTEGDKLKGLMRQKGGANCNYFLRKWGCRSERSHTWVRALHGTCKHKTPFGKDVPLWYWRTTKDERERDKEVELQRVPKPDDKDAYEIWDLRKNQKIFDAPNHYGEWQGYYEPSGSCRLTGQLGSIQHPLSAPTNASGPLPNCY